MIFLGFAAGETARTAHRHHQAVRKLAPGFEVTATTHDGTIEAIIGRGHFGIQWHAESDGTAKCIYSSFVSQCRPAVASHVIGELIPKTI